MSEKEVYIRIKGRVQGIGFRRWAVRKANEIGHLSGWVRNTGSGAVEILMRGYAPRVDMMVEACRKGPLLSRVDDIEFIGGRLSGFLPPIEDGVFVQI